MKKKYAYIVIGAIVLAILVSLLYTKKVGMPNFSNNGEEYTGTVVKQDNLPAPRPSKTTAITINALSGDTLDVNQIGYRIDGDKVVVVVSGSLDGFFDKVNIIIAGPGKNSAWIQKFEAGSKTWEGEISLDKSVLSKQKLGINVQATFANTKDVKNAYAYLVWDANK